MKKRDKTKKQLIKELTQLRRRVVELETSGRQRNRFEETLRTERDKAQQYLDIAEVILVALNKKGEITLINRKGNQILGYKEGELLGKNWFTTCLPSHLRKKMKSGFLKLMAGKREITEFYENPVLTKSGTERIIAWHNTILKDKTGNIIGTLSSGEDITERKQAETALKESEKRFRTIFEGAIDGILLADIETKKFPAGNAMICKMLGYSLEEIKNLGVMDIHPQETLPFVMEQFDKLAKEEITKTSELPVKRKDGSVFYAEISTVMLKLDGGSYLMGTFRDITERKRAEKELRESEERFRLAFENANTGVCLVDLEGNLTRVNNKMCEIFGYTKEELERMTVNDIALPEDINKSPEFIQKTLQGEIDRDTFEKRYFHKKGHVVTCEVSSSLVRNAEGAPLYFISHVHDITDRKQAEKKLQESEEHYRTLFGETLVGICLADAETGIIIDCNQALAALVCRERAELIGRPQTILHPPQNDKAAFSPTFKQHLTDKEGQILETRVVTRTGDIREVEIKANLLDLQGRKLLQGLFHDITERKRAEAALRESEEKYRMIVENSRDIIFTLGHAGEFVYLSPAISDVLGYSQAELIGHTFQSLIHPEDQPVVQDVLRRNITEGYQTSGTEYRVRHASGEWRWHMARGSVVRNEKDDFLYFTGVAQDITERKQAEDRLKESEAKYRSLVENSLEGISLSRGDRLFFANQALLNMTGYETAEEFLHVPLLEHIAPESRDLIRGILKKQQRGKPVPARFSFKIVRKDGDIRDLEASFAEALVEGESCIQSTYRDITERKQAEEEVKRGYEQLQETLHATVNALASTVEMKDQYTAGHQPRATHLACAIAEEMGLSNEQIEGIRMAASIHDIGKIVVPAEILNKPGPLTDIQYEMVKMHPRAGFDVVKGIKFPWPVAQIVLQHHELMDGSGYPQGLSGDEIMMEARILTVANVVEAMTSHRPYRPAFDIKVALAEISKNKGILYDSAVVDACLRLFAEKGFTLDSMPR
jgi:PAS domain S-box-containing protein